MLQTAQDSPRGSWRHLSLSLSLSSRDEFVLFESVNEEKDEQASNFPNLSYEKTLARAIIVHDSRFTSHHRETETRRWKLINRTQIFPKLRLEKHGVASTFTNNFCLGLEDFLNVRNMESVGVTMTGYAISREEMRVYK